MASREACCGNYPVDKMAKLGDLSSKIASEETNKEALSNKRNKILNDLLGGSRVTFPPGTYDAMKAEVIDLSKQVKDIMKSLATKYKEKSDLIRDTESEVQRIEDCLKYMYNKTGCLNAAFAKACCEENNPANVLKQASGTQGVSATQAKKPQAGTQTNVDYTGTGVGTKPGDTGKVNPSTAASQDAAAKDGTTQQTAPNGGQTVSSANQSTRESVQSTPMPSTATSMPPTGTYRTIQEWKERAEEIQLWQFPQVPNGPPSPPADNYRHLDSCFQMYRTAVNQSPEMQAAAEMENPLATYDIRTRQRLT
jgi:hypothetical protein